MAGDEGSRAGAIRRRTRAELTHLEKVLYPAAGVTKLDVIAYYARVARFLLPFLHDRPITMHRFPDGVGQGGFFEKDAPEGAPAFVETFTHWAEAPGRDVDFVLCNNLDTPLWIANLASLEVRATLSRAASYDSPDLLFLDIDPEPPFAFDDVIEVAHVVRDQLEERGLRPFVKTSGKKGVHIVVPLAPGHSFTAVREFAHEIGKAVARDAPRVVSEFPRSREAGTIFIDYLQNAPGKTMIAPYSLRATPGATVSAPLRWDDLRQGLRPEEFTCRAVASREDDPWRDLFDDRQTIP